MLAYGLFIFPLAATVFQLNAYPVTTTTYSPYPTYPTNRCAVYNGIQSSTTTQCFIFVNQTLTFIQAENYCQTNFGGHLASINSAFDNMLIIDYARIRFDVVGLFYIGLLDINADDNWKWQDGTPVDYTDWVVDLPFHPSCVNMDISSAKWYTFDCYTQAFFLCSF
uniref:C-type lectin domain-containing protein n=1 Tax=Panagrellus redivivus TaxID=6233 RepID=A0A7E4VNF0_PANRE